MKKRKKNNNLLLIISISIISIILLYYFLNNNISFRYLKNITGNIFNISSDKEIDNKVINSEIKDLNKQIEELKKINNIDKVISDKKIINASVIKRSTPYWHDIITINKGKKDGIKKGNAVMSYDGLIGKIISTENNTSDVKLITKIDKEYLSVKFSYNSQDYYGIIKKYNIIDNELYMDNVIGDFNEKDVIDKDVVTSGLSNNMPSGLFIGKIIKIKKDKYNLSSQIIIKLNANINDINIVSVVGEK